LSWWAENLAKDDVLAIKPGRGHGGDEKLRSVGVGARVGHRELCARERVRARARACAKKKREEKEGGRKREMEIGRERQEREWGSEGEWGRVRESEEEWGRVRKSEEEWGRERESEGERGRVRERGKEIITCMLVDTL